MKYKVKIVRAVAANHASYTSEIISQVRTLWPDPIERSQVAEALSAINAMIDDLDLVLNRNTTTKGDMLHRKYSDAYSELHIYNINGTKEILTISFEPIQSTYQTNSAI